jgi:NAD+ synthase (glutamine-hydrolysing)
MAFLRLALAQLNPTVGDLVGNSALIVDAAKNASMVGSDLLAVPEMMLTGYPVEDLALRPSFRAASIAALNDLAAELGNEVTSDLVVVVGYLDDTSNWNGGAVSADSRPLNAAAVIHNGAIVARYSKHHLPNYGVFDEFRYFEPGSKSCVIRVRDVDVALAICEDIWQDGGPVARVASHGAGLLLVINGSPYEQGKLDIRYDLVAQRGAEAGCTVAYVNMVGGQDELVFDGASMVLAADGTLIASAPQFTSDLLVSDLLLPDAPTATTLPGGIEVMPIAQRPFRTLNAVLPRLSVRLEPLAEVYEALVLALRDFINKNGFPSVITGVSGGIDSSLVMTIAVDALGPDRVYGVSLPSAYSSQHSQDDAAELAKRTGLHFRTVPIAPMVNAFVESLGLTGLAEENVQARVRGTTLMALSNAEGHLVLANGNKSELATGYSTIYGDAVGGYAPIKDVPKTLVWELARWRNDAAIARGETPPIPPNSIEKPPSAELRPGQLDSDSLPEYLELDEVLDGYVEHDHGATELVAAGFHDQLVDRVLSLVDRAEFKRRQYPPGTKISGRAFGRDRRLPITNRWREPTAD